MVRDYLRQCVSQAEQLCGVTFNDQSTGCRQVCLVRGVTTTSAKMYYYKVKLLPAYGAYPSNLRELDSLDNHGMIYVGHHELVKWTSDDVSDAALLSWLQGGTGLQVEHLCNTPSCSNLAHLHLCTAAENGARRCGSAGAVCCSRCNDSNDMLLFCAVLHPSTPPCIHAAQMAVHQAIANRRAKWEQLDHTNDLQSQEEEIATWGEVTSKSVDYGLSQATNKELQNALQQSAVGKTGHSTVQVHVGAMKETFQFVRQRIAARLHTAKWWLNASLRTIVHKLTASHLCHCDTCVDPAHLVTEPMWYNTDRKLCALEYRSGLQLQCNTCGDKIQFQCPHVPPYIPHVHPLV
eukprot:TRINITY_DN3108_c0_g2_i2.p1 TRINITY_DN3108_c0_g2~~TRINITY_DN3108_c0_g2_i2.p1  ORF type:complete len:349 (-),score=66.80 TRINITY_DN3108_c0_g2_i2:859-1905(-)